MRSAHYARRQGLAKLLTTLLATTAIIASDAAGAQTVLAQPASAPIGAAVQNVTPDEAGYGGQVAVAAGGSRILRFSQPIGQVLVGNPKVADVIPLGERTIYVMGSGAGATSLTVMPRAGGMPLATLEVRVGYDVDSARRAMRDVIPDEALDLSVRGDGLVLTGTASSSAAAARAAALAEQYAPGKVVNLTSIRGAEQVMLSVRVAEVQRSALQQLGLTNLSALWDPNHSLTIAPPSGASEAIAALLGREAKGNWSYQGLFEALERKGFASTLAEPNLVALSGETAVFFAGGEFPVPVPQAGQNGGNLITIQYKQYGVSVGFTPTVYGDTINLAVAPEVSALDPANSVVLEGFRIPGLTTRRAKTTVELRNGQSFAIAGLIRREFSDSLRGLPGISRAPVFGALFRSTGYQNNETEVVIIVTAHLAQPTDRRNLVVPTDLRRGPSEADLFLGGATDQPRPLPTAARGPAATAVAVQAVAPPPAVAAPAERPAPAVAPVAVGPLAPLAAPVRQAALKPSRAAASPLRRPAPAPTAPARPVAASAAPPSVAKPAVSPLALNFTSLISPAAASATHR
jgi:pilus assembly protein CpaC